MVSVNPEWFARCDVALAEPDGGLVEYPGAMPPGKARLHEGLTPKGVTSRAGMFGGKDYGGERVERPMRGFMRTLQGRRR